MKMRGSLEASRNRKGYQENVTIFELAENLRRHLEQRQKVAGVYRSKEKCQKKIGDMEKYASEIGTEKAKILEKMCSENHGIQTK